MFNISDINENRSGMKNDLYAFKIELKILVTSRIIKEGISTFIIRISTCLSLALKPGAKTLERKSEKK